MAELRRGTVTAVPGGGKVTVDGAAYSKLASYEAPALNDVVWMLVEGSVTIVLGKVG